MSIIAKRISLRCIIEGKEIPVIGASIQVAPNSPAVATIQVVPLDNIHNLKQKSMVELFFYDIATDEYDFSNLNNYKAIFSGLLVGYQMMVSPTGRSAMLQCLDHSCQWDTAYQYMITYGPNGNVLTPEDDNYAAGDDKFNDIIDGHAAVLLRYLGKTPLSPGLKNIRGLVGGIISFIEAFGGVDKHTSGVNDYFAISELRQHIIKQIVAEDNDNTAHTLFDEKEFMEWLERGVSTLGELCRLSDMINLLFKYIYYEYVTNVTPMYTPGNGKEDTSVNFGVKVNNGINELIASLIDDKIYENIYTRVTNAINTLRSLLNLSSDKKQKRSMDQAINNLVKILDEDEYNKTVASLISSAKKILASAITKDTRDIKQLITDRLGSFIFKPECYFVAPPRCNVIFPDHKTQYSFSRNFLGEPTRLRLQSGMAFIGNERLLADFSYAPTTKEIVALSKEQGTRGVRGLLPWEKFSGIQPRFEHINEINYVANKRQRELQKGTVKKVETGKTDKTGEKNMIKLAISVKQKAANFNFYKYRFGSRQMNLSCRFNPYLIAGFPCLIIDRPFYISQQDIKDVANKQGFKLDNINEDNIVNNIDTLASLLKAPVHYIGYIVSLNHNIDQSGGSTTCSLSHCRTHKLTNDDYLSTLTAKVIKQAGKEIVTTYLNIDDLISANNQEMIKKMIDLTYEPIITYPESSLNDKRPKLKVSGLNTISANFRPAEQKMDTTETGQTKEVELYDGVIKIPLIYGKIAPGSNGFKGGKIKEVQVVDEQMVTINGKKCWRTLIIYEERESKELIKPIPVEEILRPNWFSPLYSNLYIGENIYKKFIGCGSIVDQLVFNTQTGTSVQGLSSQESRDLILSKMKTISIDETNITMPDPKLYDIPSCETAANILAFQYAQAIKSNADIERFINDYTSRPIATWIDLLGTPDLDYKKVGDKLEISSGKGGFFSTSFAYQDELAGLLDDSTLGLPSRFGNGKTSKISKTLDIRKSIIDPVKEYVEDLSQNEKIIGLLV